VIFALDRGRRQKERWLSVAGAGLVVGLTGVKILSGPIEWVA